MRGGQTEGQGEGPVQTKDSISNTAREGGFESWFKTGSE